MNYFLYRNKNSLDYDKIASAIFTQPEVGSIGLGENDLKKRNIPYKVLQTEFKPLKYAFSKKICFFQKNLFENPNFKKAYFYEK